MAIKYLCAGVFSSFINLDNLADKTNLNKFCCKNYTLNLIGETENQPDYAFSPSKQKSTEKNINTAMKCFLDNKLSHDLAK